MTGESEFLTEAKTWADRSSDLARWVSRYLVNRKDAWGRYTPVACRGQLNKRTNRIVGPTYTETKKRLTSQMVARHFRCRAPEHVVGMFAISQENTCRWIVIDIDAHAAEIATEVQDRNFRFATHVWKNLSDLGFFPLLTDSNGRGGYHIRVVFSEPIPAGVAFRFANSLIQDAPAWGFDESPEVFPKRPDRNTPKGFGGGWVRLPGRHHSQNVLTRVWDGENWLKGHSAIEALVAKTGDTPSHISSEFWTEPVLVEPRALEAVPAKIAVRPEGESRRFQPNADAHVNSSDRLELATRIAASHPPAVAGERGHDVCFRLACQLVLGCNLTVKEALPVLEFWNQGCLPPWSDPELLHKLSDADQKPDRRGYLLYAPTTALADPPLLHVPAVFKPQMSMTEYRSLMATAREQSRACKGEVFLDRSPTGTGKTTADVHTAIQTVKAGGRALIVAPVHANCREIESDFDGSGVVAAAYPARITSQKLDDLTSQLSDDSSVWGDLPDVNCWDEGDAELAQAMGLPVTPTICLGGCPFLERCRSSGYLHELGLAESASVGIATHKRGVHQGLASLSEDREFVAIHEDPTELLRPTDVIPKTDLLQVQSLLNEMLNNPRLLKSDWFNAVEADGTPCALYPFMLHFSRTVDAIVTELENAERTVVVEKPFAMARPRGIERLLFKYCRESDTQFEQSPWRGLLAWAAGEADGLAVMVSAVPFSNEKHNAGAFKKAVVVSWSNPPHTESTVWIGDSTADLELLQLILPERRIHDATPNGALELQKKVIQIPQNITRQHSADKVRQYVRALLYERREAYGVGVICHKPHFKAVKALQKEFGDRVSRVTYFGKGDERSSNCWNQECDLLICIGTPRPGPDAIRRRLIQYGLLEDAALETPCWCEHVWIAQTEDGSPVSVLTKAYAQSRWQQVYQSLCRASLIQCVGRSRALLESGIDVIVISTEPLGLPVRPAKLGKISDTGGRILRLMQRGTQHLNKPLKAIAGTSYINKSNSRRCAAPATDPCTPVTTAQICTALKKCSSHVRDELGELCTAGLVEKVGERGGWLLTDIPPPQV